MTSYRYEARFTHNMGNYESLQVSESLETDAMPGEKSDDLRARVQAKVNGWIMESIEDVERDIRGLRGRLEREQQEG